MEEEAIEASDVRRTSRISVYERTLSLEPEVRSVHTHGDAARLESTY